MKKLAMSVLAGLTGTLVGCLGALLVAQSIPRCGEDCFAFAGTLMASGGIAGAVGFVVASVGLNRKNCVGRMLGLAAFALLLTSGAAWMTARHFSPMHDVQEDAPPGNEQRK